MFTYYLAYNPLLWRGYEKRGFLNELTGVRFNQCILQTKELSFNSLAAVDGELYNLVKDNNYSFYIDRLQGGIYFENYNYDFNIVNSYKNLLGEKFTGFQMHEWLSNFRQDLKRLESCKEFTEENIIKTIRKNYPFEHLYLESHSAKEFAQMGKIDNLNDFMRQGRQFFKKRQDYTDNLLIPCDSYYLAYPLEISCGAKRLMPEIGAQIPHTRIQVAFARGMAKAHNIPFGTYYEPWGGDPFSTCLYHNTGFNEWNLNNEDTPFKTNRQQGGSSRSLQWRLYLYSYLAGAKFIADEWGGANIFYDFNGYELTPYGKLQFALMNFIRKYNDIGKIYTPICLVLPKDMPAVLIDGTLIRNDSPNLPNWQDQKVLYMSYEVQDEGFKNIITTSHDAIKQLFAINCASFGNEHSILINSPIPDAFDICTNDKLNDDYEYYIDLTNTLKNKKTVTAKEAKALINTLMPCSVSGNCHWFVNKSTLGWYLTVLNNDGIDKSQNGEKLIDDAKSIVIIEIKDNKLLKQLEGNCKLKLYDNKYYLELEAGGWFFGKIA